MRITSLIVATALALLHSAPVDAGRLKGQAVTWADFNHIVAIATSLNYVYFATSEGVMRYDKQEHHWTLPLTGADGLDSDLPQRIWVERFDERLYLETTLGLYEYDPLFERWFQISELPEFESQTRHIKTPVDLLPPPGLSFVDENSVTDNYSRRYLITDVVDDGAGDLWVGTWGYGAATAGSSARLLELLPFGLLQEDVRTIHRDGPLLWLAGAVGNSERTGLTSFNTETSEFSFVESGVTSEFPSANVYALATTGRYIYVGTDDGLYILNRAGNSVVRHLSRRNGLLDESVKSLLLLGDSLLIGTTGGINLITGVNDSVRYVYPGHFQTRAVYDFSVSHRYIWIASDIGAFRLSRKSGKLQRFNDPNGVLFSRVFKIDQYQGTVWFVSEAGVVSLDLSNGKTTAYRDIARRSDGRAFAVNDHVLALASDNGVLLYFLDKEKDFSREFTRDDGLASNDVNALKFEGDYLWVGTDHGLTRFLWNNPERVD